MFTFIKQGGTDFNAYTLDIDITTGALNGAGLLEVLTSPYVYDGVFMDTYWVLTFDRATGPTPDIGD